MQYKTAEWCALKKLGKSSTEWEWFDRFSLCLMDIGGIPRNHLRLVNWILKMRTCSKRILKDYEHMLIFWVCRWNGEPFLYVEVVVGRGWGIQGIIIRWYFSNDHLWWQWQWWQILPNDDDKAVLHSCNHQPTIINHWIQPRLSFFPESISPTTMFRSSSSKFWFDLL